MKICYINFNLENPRDRITLRGFREIGVDVKEISDKSSGWKKYFRLAKEYRSSKKNCDLVMVGYAGSILVIFLWFLTRKKIVYNALATFYDSMIVSRFGGAIFSFKSLWYYLVDWFAFRCANQVFLECEAQKDLVVRVFGIRPGKISVQFVGTDDQQFFFDSAIPKLKQFTAVFRGAFLPEAGADVVVRAAKELEKEKISIRIIGRGLLLKDVECLKKELSPTNLELITTLLPVDILRQKMLECHVSLGQLAKHPRVHTTIPHKVFESMSMRLPYLTGENKGVMEVVHDNETCFTVPPGDPHALAQKIIELQKRASDLNRVASNAYELYQKEFTPKVLAEKIINSLTK